MSDQDYEVFELPEFVLQRGITLPCARIAYRTYGRLAADRSNVILYPTSYAAQHPDIDWLIGPGQVLDPTDWFIVIPNMFTNGLSTSPSNLAPPFGPDRSPAFTHWDNVQAQRRLLADVFGVDTLALVLRLVDGGSAGAALGGDLPPIRSRASALFAVRRGRRFTTRSSSRACAPP